MFEHFTFGAQTQPTDQQVEISASPTDTSISSPASTCHQSPSLEPWSPSQPDTVDGIAHKFSQQSLRLESNESPQHLIWQDQFDISPSPDFELDEAAEFTPEEDMSYVSTTHCMASAPRPILTSTCSSPDLPTLPHPRGGTLICRRLQRQINVHMQSSNAHIRDINALVEDMINSNSQCRLHQSTSRPYLTSPPPSTPVINDLVVDTTDFQFSARNTSLPEDEGFSEIADEDWGVEEEMSLQRASTPSGIRKYGIIKWRGSAECVSAVNAAGRVKIRCVPRMRRRKPKTGPE